MKKISLIILMIFYFGGENIFAQNMSISENTQVTPYDNFTNGELICAENLQLAGGSLRKSNVPYDALIIGVFIKFEGLNPNYKKIPVRKEGIFQVKYNSENGAIKKGDLVTSSSEAGTAMKATKSGMIVGIALEDATSSSGLLKIRVLIQYVKQ